MAQVRFYTDEHVSRAVVRGLRQRGVDVLTVSEVGMLEASDEEHRVLPGVTVVEIRGRADIGPNGIHG